MALTRPSAEVYRQILDYYQTGTDLETIADRLGLDLDMLEQLEHDGFPAEGKLPVLPALKTMVLERLMRIQAGKLDLLAAAAESASKTAPHRSKTAVMAAMVENAIMTAFSKQVTAAMKKPKPDWTELAMSRQVLDTLRVLRRLQDPTVDRRFVEIFVRTGGHDAEQGDTYEDAIFRDLADLDDDELAHWEATGERPKRQQELFPEEMST